MSTTQDSRINSDTIIILVAVLLVVFIIGFGIFTWTIVDRFDQYDSRINNIESNADQRYTSLKSEVSDTILEVLESQKQQAIQSVIDSRLAPHKAADNDVPDGRKIYGSLKARFTIVEFSDLECPFCKQFHSTPKEIVDSSRGNVSWEWKHLPLGIHNPAALKLAHAAECVSEQKGNQGFWAYIDYVFSASGGNGRGISDTTIRRDLAEFGVDQSAFNTCMTEGRHMASIQDDLQDARKLRVTSTPTSYIVDNVTGQSQPMKGLKSTEQIMQVIKMMIDQGSETKNG